MNRDLTLERVYKLADYNTLRIGGDINAIPERFLWNHELIGNLYYLLLSEVELAYYKYAKMREKTHNYNLDDAIGVLEETTINVLDDIKILLTTTIEKGEN